MPKPIIAIDCDDVIVPTAPAILAYYNRTYGTQLELKDLYSRNLSLWAATTYEAAVERVNTFLASEAYQKVLPFSQAIAVVSQLSVHYELQLVTARPDFLEAATHTMLKENFPGMFQAAQFTNFFGTTKRSKAKVCQEIGAAVLIDDHLHHAEEAAECGIDVLLFGDYLWNQATSLPPRISRMKDWNMVAQELLPKKP